MCYIGSSVMRFDETKATQAAAYFLEMRPHKRMHYFLLIKLLYLADREALLQRGVPITTDHYVSMKHGPIVSTIYNLISKPKMPKPIWSQYISDSIGNKEVRLLKLAPTDKLSRAEEKIMRGVYEQYGHWNRYKLRDYVLHKLPEWKDPGSSSTPISVADILRAGGQDEREIQAVQHELDAFEVEERKFHKAVQ